MRIAIAEISQETDTFNPYPTVLQDFKETGMYLGDEILEKMRGVRAIGGFMDAAQDAREDSEDIEDIELVPIIQAYAVAGGRVAMEALAFLEKKLVSGLQGAGSLDGVLLSLHGACAAEEIDDVEGYLLAAVRKVVGDEMPVVVALDHHANITDLMIERADVLVGHETQPHNLQGTGFKAAQTLFALLGGEFSPTVGWYKIPMIAPQDQFLTESGPMKAWFDLAREIERRPEVVSVSPFPMQPWLDVEQGGWSAVVYTDDDPGLARTLAAELADKAWELRQEFWVSERLSPEEAVRQADAADEGLVILSDVGDVVYGGGPGDSPRVLRAMLSEGIQSMALVPLVDPEAVEQAMEAGVGSTVTLALGGKFDTVFNEPLEVTGTVGAVSKGLSLQVGDRGYANLDRTVLLEIDNVKVVLLTHRSVTVNQPILYTHLGLDVDEAKMVVVKTAGNFQYFAPWRKGLIRVDSPGMTQSDLNAFEWTHVPRPIYPLDELPDWQASV